MTTPFTVTGEHARLVWWTAWLSKLCAHRLLGDVQNNKVLLDFSQPSFLKYARRRCYSILPNRRYIDGVATLIHSSLKSTLKLGVNVDDIELCSWLLFQCEGEKVRAGNQNIRLTSPSTVEVLVFEYNGKPRRIELKLRPQRRYSKLLQHILGRVLNREIGLPARVVVKEYNFYPGNMHLYCELQVMIPYKLYLETMRRYGEPLYNHVGGVNVNVDRINLAVIDRYGRLRDVKTFWFREVVSRGYRRKQAYTRIHQAVHDLLRYAYHHGVHVLFLENPLIIGYLRYYWIKSGDRRSRNYNYKKSIFRNKIIEIITYKAPLYSIDTRYVDPRGTSSSREHDEIMRKYGLDKHTASAYLVALKGLKLT